MKIIVLAGGLSTERDVSLSSAAGICRTLLEKGHDAYLLMYFWDLRIPRKTLRTSSRFRDTVWRLQRISERKNLILRP